MGGFISADFPAARPSSFNLLHLFSRFLFALPSFLKIVLQGSKTMSYNSGRRIISRSWLHDWNPQPLSSSHMALSILFTMAEPVTLRLRLPGMLP